MKIFTVRPQRQVIMLDNAEPEVVFEECSEAEATHWSVFEDNRHQCDCASRRRAEKIAKIMEAAHA